MLNPKTRTLHLRSVVLVYRHDRDGTEGVIINQEIGPLEQLLYPNGSKSLTRRASLRGRSPPSLRFGGYPSSQLASLPAPACGLTLAQFVLSPIGLWP